jgi:hypothetical protein
MAAVQDFSLNAIRNDLLIQNGDFVISDSDKNHIYLILKTVLGDWKQYPLVGCGLDYYQASSGMEQIIQRNMTVQLTADGYKVISITTNPNEPDNYNINAIRQ